MLLKERRYQGIVTYHRGDFQEVLDAIAKGKITPQGMITKTIPLEDVVEGGFQALIHDKVRQIRSHFKYKAADLRLQGQSS